MPSDKVPLHIRMTGDVAAALQDQDVDLIRLLREQGYDVERSAAPDPSKPVGSRDAGLVIVASGAALYMVGLAIVRIIKAATGGPVVGELGALRPVETSKGEVVRDADGNVLTYREGEKQILRPDEQQRNADTTITIPSLLEIKVTDR